MDLTRIIIGICAGAVLYFCSQKLIGVLLKKRNRSFERKKWEMPLLLVLAALFGAAILLLERPVPETVYLLLLLLVCLTVSVIDAHIRLIPNDLVFAIIALTVVFGLPALFGAAGFPAWKPLQSLLGLIVCFAIFFLPGLFGKKVGAGDVKLAAAAGFCLGLTGSLYCIVLMGLFVLLFMLLRYRFAVVDMLKAMVPMGPFICLGMMLVLLFIRTGAAASFPGFNP